MTVSEGLPLNSKYIKMGRKVMRGEGEGRRGGSSRWSEMSENISSKDICLLEVLQTRLCERKKS